MKTFIAKSEFGNFTRTSEKHNYGFAVVACADREDWLRSGAEESRQNYKKQLARYEKVVDLETLKADCAADDARGDGSWYAREHGNFAATCKIYGEPGSKGLNEHIAQFKVWADQMRESLSTLDERLEKSIASANQIFAAKKGGVLGFRRDMDDALSLAAQFRKYYRVVKVVSVQAFDGKLSKKDVKLKLEGMVAA